MKSAKSLFALMCIAWFALEAFGGQVDSKTAATTVKGWLQADHKPFGEPLGQNVKGVETFKDAAGRPLYHVVYLEPTGFVIVSAEDQTKPVIAFVKQGQFDPSPANPLGALVSRDLPARVAHARARGGTPAALKHRGEWQKLQERALGGLQPNGITGGSISDLRVAPLVQTHWNQLASDNSTNGPACYNFFTPPFAAGNAGNYACGCVATALAQLMYYFQYPTVGVGTPSFVITLTTPSGGTHEISRSLRGGDGRGGPYVWANMPAIPGSGATTLAQRAAIGALTSDAGVASLMQYTPVGAAAFLSDAKSALLSTFRYGNAVLAEALSLNVGFDLTGVINPNLDARRPVVFGIDNSAGGHCILCDGYGYDAFSTLYHHVNMGWGGIDDAWYALPVIDLDDTVPFLNLDSCVYNVFTSGGGEIISGRVVDPMGVPVSNVNITGVATNGSVYKAVTDINGIYALAGVPSASSFTLTASSVDYYQASLDCTTATSQDNATKSGNVWGANFTLIPAQGPPVITGQPQDQTVTVGKTVTFNVSAGGKLPFVFQWQYQAKGGSSWTNLSDGGNYSGAGTATLSVTPDGSLDGEMIRCVVTNSLGSATSAQAVLRVIVPLPVITAQPQEQAATVGENAMFAISASGQLPLVYQWQYQTQGGLDWNNLSDGINYKGSATEALTVMQTDISLDGEPFRCVVTNAYGSVTSSPAILRVIAAPFVRAATIAGSTGINGSTNGAGANALFNYPRGVAVDNNTNVYVADLYNHVIRKLTPSGTNWVVSTIAGLAGTSGSSDGLNEAARFNGPYGVAVDGNGNVYVADTGSSTIRRLTPSGADWVVKTIGGLAGSTGSSDGSTGGSNNVARFRYPTGLAVDGAGNIYVADQGNSTIRKLTPSGSTWTASTIAGSAGSFGTADGANGVARFGEPYGVAVDKNGIVYVVDKFNNNIRQLTLSGAWVVTTIAGLAGTSGSADGVGGIARFGNPTGIAVGSDGNVYVADLGNNTIRKMSSTGVGWAVVTIAGVAGSSGSVDGIGNAARFNGPFGVAVDNNANIYVTDSINSTIRRLDALAAPAATSSAQLAKQADGTSVLTWAATAGRTYQVQFKSDLGQSVWTDLSTITPSSWTGVVSVPPAAGAQRFYRVRVAP